MGSHASARIALLYPGDRAMRNRSDPAESRFAALFDAFSRAGLPAVPAIYHDEFADEVRDQLRDLDAVLVWCNPIEGGRRRDRLDAMLRELSVHGVFVSAHPDAILRLGTKDVLFETRDLPFGSDVQRIDSLEHLDQELPSRLRLGPRVLKQHRGHSGVGVWRIELVDPALNGLDVLLRHAERGSEEQRVDWPTLLRTMAPYFEAANGGHMIDQAWQPRLVDGMVRAYLVRDRVAGFGHQAINALYPRKAGDSAVQAGPRLYVGADTLEFQDLKERLESGWIDLLRDRVALPPGRLPMLWDCDFMLADDSNGRSGGYVLCEINVSSVSPFPPSAIAPLIDAVRRITQRDAG